MHRERCAFIGLRRWLACIIPAYNNHVHFPDAITLTISLLLCDDNTPRVLESHRHMQMH